MAEELKEGVKQEEPPKPQEGQTKEPPATDEKGVPYLNRFKEMERKHGEIEEKLNAVLQHLSNLSSQGKPTQEELNRQKLGKFVENPDGFVDEKLNQVVIQLQAQEAEKWLKGQEGWKPEYEQAISNVIRKHGLASAPVQRAQTAWELLKMEHPDFISKREAKRQEEIRKYQIEGPGRAAPEPPSKEEEDLLKALANSRNIHEQGELIGEISKVRFKRQTGQDLLR